MIRQIRSRAPRAIFVSDVHLGSRDSRASELLQFLRSVDPEMLYLVGDFIDLWRLQQGSKLCSSQKELLRHVQDVADDGCQVVYCPGNHDAQLRGTVFRDGEIRIQDEIVHETLTGDRLLVMHGDQFDSVENRAPWLSRVGTVTSDFMTLSEGVVEGVGNRLRLPPVRFGCFARRLSRRLIGYLDDFERRACKYAEEMGARAIVCGHTHQPKLRRLSESTFINTGDWVDHASALIEYDDGEIELHEFSRSLSTRKTTSVGDELIEWNCIADQRSLRGQWN